VQFEYTDPQTEFERLIGGHFSINAFGRIDPGDDVKFHEFLTRSAPPPRTTVYIDSVGGDVDAAIAMGRLIRDAWFHTAIGRYVLKQNGSLKFIAEREQLLGACMSAATLVFIGGRLRYYNEGARFGVHQFSFKNPSPDDTAHSQVLSAKIALYVADMGISSEFLKLSSSVRSSEIKLVDEQELKRLHVVTGGVTDVTWTVQARGMLYVRGERDSLFGHHKVLFGFVKGDGFMFWAVIEAQGREQELTEFPLVEVVLNEQEDVRIDISERCMRVVNEIYVNVVAKLTKEEAKQIAYSEGIGIQIRATSEAPVFLGIAPTATEGGKEELDTFYRTLCDLV
jgi:hypothetical protein